ncbi:MAG: LysR family transcriptional regulator [Solirubrobacteraceae bacterium]
MLDLRRVRVFYEVAQRRSFSAAAEALDYTQPSVSHHIAALEGELGQRLFNRGSRPLSLTQAGEVLVRAAAVGLAEFDRAELDLVALATGCAGRVALGSVVTGLRSVVPPAVRAFREQFPDVELVLEESQAAAVLGGLRSGQLDIGVVVAAHDSEGPDERSFISHRLLTQSLMVAVPEGHRLARRKHMRLDMLKGEPLLLPSPARFPEFRGELDGLFLEAGLVPASVLESTDDLAGARLVASGVAIGLAPVLGLIRVSGVNMIPLRPAVARQLYAVTVIGRHSAAVQALLAELRAAAQRVDLAGAERA